MAGADAVPGIKICGLTRAEDAALAASLGADFVGAILAPSPRRVDPEAAREVLAPATGLARRVGVFGEVPADEIAEAAALAELDAAQLHGDPDAAVIEALRARFAGEVWGVARIRDGRVPPSARSLAGVADALVLDAWSAERLGGTGERFAWEGAAREIDRWRGGVRARIVLAGGLTPENVGEAIRAFAPDVVDVSSGVEGSPGIKDHERMRAFVDAVRRSGAGGRAEER